MVCRFIGENNKIWSWYILFYFILQPPPTPPSRRDQFGAASSSHHRISSRVLSTQRKSTQQQKEDANHNKSNATNKVTSITIAGQGEHVAGNAQISRMKVFYRLKGKNI